MNILKSLFRKQVAEDINFGIGTADVKSNSGIITAHQVNASQIPVTDATSGPLELASEASVEDCILTLNDKIEDLPDVDLTTLPDNKVIATSTTTDALKIAADSTQSYINRLLHGRISANESDIEDLKDAIGMDLYDGNQVVTNISLEQEADYLTDLRQYCIQNIAYTSVYYPLDLTVTNPGSDLDISELSNRVTFDSDTAMFTNNTNTPVTVELSGGFNIFAMPSVGNYLRLAVLNSSGEVLAYTQSTTPNSSYDTYERFTINRDIITIPPNDHVVLNVMLIQYGNSIQVDAAFLIEGIGVTIREAGVITNEIDPYGYDSQIVLSDPSSSSISGDSLSVASALQELVYAVNNHTTNLEALAIASMAYEYDEDLAVTATTVETATMVPIVTQLASSNTDVIDIDDATNTAFLYVDGRYSYKSTLIVSNMTGDVKTLYLVTKDSEGTVLTTRPVTIPATGYSADLRELPIDITGTPVEFNLYVYASSTGLTINYIYSFISVGGSALAGLYQPLNDNLTSMSLLSASSTGLVKMTAGVASLDTNTYLTEDDTTNWDTAYGWGDHSVAGYAMGTDLSAYLPKTAGSGQPLTGTLYGTSAEFSGNVTANEFYVGDSLRHVYNTDYVTINFIGASLGGSGDPWMRHRISGSTPLEGWEWTHFDTTKLMSLSNTGNLSVYGSISQGGVLLSDTYYTQTYLNSRIGNIETLLTSDDTTLDEIQEIVDYIKQNRSDLENLSASNIAGLDTWGDGRYASISSLSNYLPKSAGSSNALTGSLYGTSAEFSGKVTANEFYVNSSLRHVYNTDYAAINYIGGSLGGSGDPWMRYRISGSTPLEGWEWTYFDTTRLMSLSNTGNLIVAGTATASPATLDEHLITKGQVNDNIELLWDTASNCIQTGCTSIIDRGNGHTIAVFIENVTATIDWGGWSKTVEIHNILSASCTLQLSNSTSLNGSTTITIPAKTTLRMTGVYVNSYNRWIMDMVSMSYA